MSLPLGFLLGCSLLGCQPEPEPEPNCLYGIWFNEGSINGLLFSPGGTGHRITGMGLNGLLLWSAHGNRLRIQTQDEEGEITSTREFEWVVSHDWSELRVLGRTEPGHGEGAAWKAYHRTPSNEKDF
ncbi:MAG: hypothetical protein ACR2HJ_05555 [Fimbriimonadales bacterium]